MSFEEPRRERMYLDVERALDMMGDEQEVRGILQLAAESLRENLPKMGSLMQAGKMVEVGEILHVFKGMLPVFGTDDLIEQVTVSERTAKIGAGLPSYPEVEGKLEQLLHEIQSYLSSAGLQK